MLRRLYVFGIVWAVIFTVPGVVAMMVGLLIGLDHLVGSGAVAMLSGLATLAMSAIISEGFDQRQIPLKPLPREERAKIIAKENELRTQARIKELEKQHGIGEPDQLALEGRVTRHQGARQEIRGMTWPFDQEE